MLVCLKEEVIYIGNVFYEHTSNVFEQMRFCFTRTGVRWVNRVSFYDQNGALVVDSPLSRSDDSVCWNEWRDGGGLGGKHNNPLFS